MSVWLYRKVILSSNCWRHADARVAASVAVAAGVRTCFHGLAQVSRLGHLGPGVRSMGCGSVALSISLCCHGQHNRGACHETALRLASTCRLSGHAAAAVVIVAVAAWDLFSSAATCVTYCFAYCLFYFVFFMAYYLLFIYLPLVIVMAM